ncbi:MAG: hypothetical protein J2P53_08440, partial [Bradyrhizobiaceae bacterium]|nr:hypothetical protein [Bradyrhizobiaceae bacterium]
MVAALEACDPAIVLVEGPPDADDMIAFAGLPAMSPPLALLVHERDDPAKARFFPLAVFSPEWQAMRWALVRQRPVRFIDLPVSNRLAAQPTKDGPAAGCVPPSEEEEEEEKEKEKEENTEDAAKGDPGADASSAAAPDDELGSIRHDPLAYLAELAGYDDSEAWWNALIEQGAHGPDIFAALEAAMAALREAIDPLPWRTPEEALNERRREAHMRLAIGKALAETEAPVAVVCGAWHVPALRRAVPARDDRALVKGLASVKVTATWIPWTETRLSVHTGYGAGVVSPGWYTHLWQELQPGRSGTESAPRAAAAFATRWQARVAGLLRRNGRPVSTATVIEAVRLSLSLASLRDLALPGLAEMRDASLATLCEGERAAFRLIEQRLVVGDAVGAIDESVPQMPLAADLARSQRRLKLKPEALDADISLDLRSDAGLAKSQLLHRLALLNVPWGTALSAGHSRGSFRENWRLRWEPEFSIRLAEALVYGTTVEQAAGNAAVARAEQATSLEAISAIVRGCLDAGLDQAAGCAIARLQRQSAATNDIASLAGAVPPLADVLRYGTARAMPLEALRLLVTSLTEAVCAGLVYACRGLQPEPARELRTGLGRLN